MSRRLTGRVCVVTGGAQGLGRAIARRLAAEGAQVVVADRNAERAAAVAEEIATAQGAALSVAVDVSDPDSAHAMVGVTLDNFGRLDVLVNSAAVFSTIRMGPFERITPREWGEVMGVNLGGTFFCCQAVATQMRAQRSGSIVNISSGTVLFGKTDYAHYVASKAGIVGLTRVLARELGDDEIRVNALMPGSVETEVPRETITPEQVSTLIGRQALHRRLAPADIVGSVAFLASDDATMMTGQCLVVDGGADFV